MKISGVFALPLVLGALALAVWLGRGQPGNEQITVPVAQTIAAASTSSTATDFAAEPAVAAQLRGEISGAQAIPLFSRHLNTGPEYIAARGEADRMSHGGYVVNHGEIVRVEPESMQRFLREAMTSPKQFSEQFEFGLTSAIGPCAVSSAEVVRPAYAPGAYRIDTGCQSATGDVGIVMTFDSTRPQIAASLINEHLDLRILPIKGTQYALVVEYVKGSHPSERLPAEF